MPRNSTGSIKVTNPERVIDPSTGLTKLDLVRYYESVAERMLPHLVGPAVSLVRAPERHHRPAVLPEARRGAHARPAALDPALWPEHEALLEVPTATAVSAAQMNVLEFHTWNATARNIGKPDRMVFDLDPGEGVAWKSVQEGALLVRSLLQELALESWLKTSGGKGLHVVVPLAPSSTRTGSRSFTCARTTPCSSRSRGVSLPSAAAQPGRPDLRRLPAQQPRRHHGRGVFRARAARPRRVDARGLGDLGSLKSGAHWTVATAREHLSFQTVDPWAGYWKAQADDTRARKYCFARAARHSGILSAQAPGLFRVLAGAAPPALRPAPVATRGPRWPPVRSHA